ncbi:hypothetical protein [Cellulomonas taurus]|uniref:hypothetical protein n=1 Tax=Cellulomonas taurus TaxID=2729175 RepID=UPI00145D4947|nr:hypothetical protein [Cellulomonas taurus]
MSFTSAPEPTLAQLGDIMLSEHWISTPWGSAPLSGAQWHASDQAYPTERIPVWAIVLAVVLFPLGLFFLLMKETRWEGWIEVTVRASGLAHTTRLPYTPAASAYVAQTLAWAQSRS